MLKNWEKLPDYMKNSMVEQYYKILARKKSVICVKRIVDFIIALFLTILLSPVMLVVAIVIRSESKGTIFFRQERITRYGKTFRIFKFRTMVEKADKMGPLVTKKDDDRITKSGKILRKIRLDELPQLFNILAGDMSFVGTRPEVKKYVEAYSEEMYATLLLPAGVTSMTSILYKDEEEEIEEYTKEKGISVDEAYVDYILHKKMKHNLEYIETFSVIQDFKIMIKTIFAVLK